MAGSARNSIGRMTLEQQLAPPRKKQPRRRTPTGSAGIRRSFRSQISSRASQIAAAILFELRTVDIR
jgi:hypothetical protein